jgi:hypothetical protein
MNRHEFLELFQAELEIAARNAEKRFNLQVPRQYKIRLHPKGTSQGNKLCDVETALDRWYREDLFPLYIDLVLEAITINREVAIVFAGTSREYVPIVQTWNYKTRSGPFKQRINEELVIVPDVIG